MVRKCIIINSNFVREVMFWNYMMPSGFFYPAMFNTIVNTSHMIPQACVETVATPKIEEDVNQQRSFLVDLTEEDLLEAGYQINKKQWSEEEDEALRYLRDRRGLEWTQIAELMPFRNEKMCYSRYRRLENKSKQSWKKADDELLISLIKQHGENWKLIAQQFKRRTQKQVKQHYLNYLRPDIKKDQWTLSEDLKLIEFLNTYGKNWKYIQENFEGRTQNQIKNRYFGRLKRLAEKKILAKTKNVPENNIEQIEVFQI